MEGQNIQERDINLINDDEEDIAPRRGLTRELRSLKSYLISGEKETNDKVVSRTRYGFEQAHIIEDKQKKLLKIVEANLKQYINKRCVIEQDFKHKSIDGKINVFEGKYRKLHP